MKRLIRWLIASCVLASCCLAGIIDSRPATGVVFTGSNPVAVGGTFVADDVTLASFTLLVGPGAPDPGGQFRAIVLATNPLGAPTGPPLYVSADLPTPMDVFHELTFTPGIPIVPGSLYFIGVDNGRITSGGPGSVALGIAFDGAAIPVGTFWAITNLFPEGSSSPSADIASRIVMTGAPEPCSLLLGLAGTVSVCILRRKRRGRGR